MSRTAGLTRVYAAAALCVSIEERKVKVQEAENDVAEAEALVRRHARCTAAPRSCLPNNRA